MRLTSIRRGRQPVPVTNAGACTCCPIPIGICDLDDGVAEAIAPKHELFGTNADNLPAARRE